jgi:DNA-binding MarR family transcriptional regulator
MAADRLHELGAELMRLGHLRSASYPDARLDASAFRLLWLLEEGTPRTVSDLAAELQLDQSTLARQVSAAVGHGLVERYAEAGVPGRLLRPTEAGRAAYRHDLALREAHFGEAMDALGPERAATLTALLRELNDALGVTARVSGRQE